MKIYVRGKEIKLRGLLEYLKDIGYCEERFVGGSLRGLEISNSHKTVKCLCICDKGFDVEEDAEFIATAVEGFDTVWDKLEDEESSEQQGWTLSHTYGKILDQTFEERDQDDWDEWVENLVEKEKIIRDLEKSVDIVNGYHGTVSGVKYNEGKLPLEKVIFTQFPKAIQAVAKCSLNGNNKYKEFDKDWLNFKRVEGGSQTYADAALRHSLDKGELNDSGLPHIFHKLWNVMAEVELYIEENNLKI